MALTPDGTNDGWTVATGKSAARRHRRKQRATQSTNHPGVDTATEEEDVGTNPQPVSSVGERVVGGKPTEKQISQHLTLIQTAKDDLRRSAYCKNVLKTLEHACRGRSFDKMIVWGLGSLEQPRAPIVRCQLGLALVFIEDVLKHTTKVEMYDPVFTSLDKSVLHRLCECDIPDTNNDGSTIVNTPTLVYMPHCELFLTLMLLGTNQRSRTLGNIVMIGNSLKKYLQNHTVDPIEKNILQSYIMPCHTEIPLPELGFDCVGAFNNLSLHIFFRS